jgi:glycosyltransferase involved in cell wall biosynthesis
MNIFDVLVLPARTTPHWKEQFGHVLIEAMACETPIIGSDSGEIPNVIGDAGLTFPEGDAEALVGAIRRLMRDEDLRRDLARRGRERVLQHYTHECIAQETYRIYCELLGQEPLS